MPYIAPQSSGNRIRRLLDELRGVGLSYTHRSSKVYALTASLAREINNAEDFFSSNHRQTYLSTATGQYLDSFGALYGIVRYEPNRCTAMAMENNIQFFVQGGGTFGSINGGNDIIIPAGTILQTQPLTGAEDPMQYQVSSERTLFAAQQRAYVNANCTIDGAAGRIGPRTLISHDFTTYADSANDSLRLVNNYAIVNGSDREDDASLRFRISRATTASQGGNSTALQTAALNVPGVVDLRVIPYWDGIGTVAVFVVGQDNQTSPSLVTDVQANLNFRHSAGIMATAYMPTNVGISFETRIHTASPLTINVKNELRQRLTLAARSAITYLTIGQSIPPGTIAGLLMAVDSRITNTGTPGGNPFDKFGIWRPSLVTNQGNQRVRNELLDQSNIFIEVNEILSPEISLTNPFTFIFTS